MRQSNEEIELRVDLLTASKQEAIDMRLEFAKCIAEWTRDIKEVKTSKQLSKDLAPNLRLADYTNPMQYAGPE